MSRRRKIAELPLEMFTEMFNIPENGRVVAAYPNPARNSLELVIESEAFKECLEGQEAPRTYPLFYFYRQDEEGRLYWRIDIDPDYISRLDFVADEEE